LDRILDEKSAEINKTIIKHNINIVDKSKAIRESIDKENLKNLSSIEKLEIYL